LGGITTQPVTLRIINSPFVTPSDLAMTRRDSVLYVLDTGILALRDARHR
jgi:hypothetical protein